MGNSPDKRREAVYPRWRGEHSYSDGTYDGRYGLSPLARGTRRFQVVQIIQRRFIPAGAGNTRFAPSCVKSSPVYPRWRGEHREANEFFIVWIGLSPLARGTCAHPGKKLRTQRFIPAGAGNTLPLPSGNYRKAVYPRWRGEHTNWNECVKQAGGLSPLARGTLG